MFSFSRKNTALSLGFLICSFLVVVAMLSTPVLGQAQSLTDFSPCPEALTNDDARSRQEGEKWDVSLSPYTYHWIENPNHRPVFLIAVDRHVAGDRFCGLALFRNSFGQPSVYAYVGQQWKGVLGHPQLFTKLSIGFIHGYHGKYQDKIYLNRYGIAPAIVPALGYHVTPQDSFQLMLLGNTAILFAYAHTF